MSIKNNNLMNFLITGANSFVGKHVCHFLLNKGCKVKGTNRNSIIELSKFRQFQNFESIKLDLGTTYKNLKDINKVDFIIHIAGCSKDENRFYR